MKKSILQFLGFASILLFSATLPSCMVVNETITHVDCDSKYTGAIDLDITSPGTTITKIDWSNNAITEDIGFLSAGNYEVKIDALNTSFGNSTIHQVNEYYVGYKVKEDISSSCAVPLCTVYSENRLEHSQNGFVEFEYSPNNGTNIEATIIDETVMDISNSIRLELTAVNAMYFVVALVDGSTTLISNTVNYNPQLKQTFKIEIAGTKINFYHNGQGLSPMALAHNNSSNNFKFSLEAIGDMNSSISNLYASFGGCDLNVENKIDACDSYLNDNKKNWVASWGYDDEGNVISAGKSYFDDMGRPTQAQTINVEDNLIWTSETKYDAYGRFAISTKAAPVMTDKFCYKENFMKSKVSGLDYDIDDFDTDLTENNPNAVENTEAGTLGWYYSDNNTLEPYQATTDYPYSRSSFFNEPSGSVKQVSGASDAFKMGSSHLGKSFTMPIKGELYDCYGLKSPFASANINGAQLNLDTRTLLNGVKTINVDPHGQETISFTDLEGNVLASAYSGALDGSNQGIQKVSVLVPPNEYRDIHVPNGCELLVQCGELSSSIFYDIDANFVDITGDLSLTTYNEQMPDGTLQTNTNHLAGLLPGYYRVQNTSNTSFVINYTLNYYDFSLNYYDIAGRLVMSVPPEGVDCNPLTYTKTEEFACRRLQSLNFIQTFGRPINLPTSAEIQTSTFSIYIDDNLTGCLEGCGGSVPVGVKSMMINTSSSSENNQIFKKSLGESSGLRNTNGGGTENQGINEGGGGPPPACPTMEYYTLEIEIYGNDINVGEVLLATNEFSIYRYPVASGIYSDQWIYDSGIDYVLNTIQSQTIDEVYFKVIKITHYYKDCDGNFVDYNNTYPDGAKPIEVITYPCNVDVFDEFSIHFDLETYLYQNLTANAHTMQNTYGYNALGNMIWQDNPDENTTEYLYTREGEIRFSQNELQKENGRFSYTNYDGLGRIKEVGEYDASIGTTSDWATNVNSGDAFYFNSLNFDLGLIPNADPTLQEINKHSILNDKGTLADKPRQREVTRYYYDFSTPDPLPSGRIQKFLSSAVSYTEKDKDNDDSSEYATYYSYDIQGRVEWIVQKNDLGLKTIDYEYDLMSNVLSSTYQQGQADEFKHIYEYDKINRLIAVRTKDEGGNEDLQAAYKYYLHGPLKRVEIADNLQGVDFVYTAEGMLKSINHPNLNKEDDPGADTDDLFGMAIDYYTGDYKRDGANLDNTGLAITGFDDQYNGNIRDIRWNTDGLSTISGTNIIQAPNPNASKYVKQNIYSFTYNQKNWLTSAVAGNIEAYTNKKVAVQCRTCPNPNTMTLPSFGIYEQSLRWKVDNLSYDKNGNILSLDRTGSEVTGTSPFNIAKPIDQLTYNYNTGVNNKLEYLTDGIANNISDNIGDLQNQTTGNYTYNSIGQLTKDVLEDNFIDYDVYGKVSVVWNKDKTFKKASYEYDNNGFRVKKTLYEQIAAIPPSESNPLGTPQLETKRTYYVRDANGTVLNILEWEYDISGSNPWHVETPIYGSGRLGVRYATVNSSNFSGLNIGSSVYELTDHLGNVRASFSKDATSGLLVKESHADYYPFGWVMPGRSLVSANKYRFGYQGEFSEKDEETGWNSFELRSLDTRIGRWMNTDPKYQYWSPYMSMGNNPVNGVDEDGGWVHIAAGAIIGGGIAAYSLYKDGKLNKAHWKEAALKIGVGAGTGALIAAVPLTAAAAPQLSTTAVVLAGSFEAGAIATTSSIIGQNIDVHFGNEERVSLSEAAVSGVVTTATFGIGSKIGLNQAAAARAQSYARHSSNFLKYKLFNKSPNLGAAIVNSSFDLFNFSAFSFFDNFSNAQSNLYSSVKGISSQTSTYELSNAGRSRVDGVIGGGVLIDEVTVTP